MVLAMQLDTLTMVLEELSFRERRVLSQGCKGLRAIVDASRPCRTCDRSHNLIGGRWQTCSAVEGDAHEQCGLCSTGYRCGYCGDSFCDDCAGDFLRRCAAECGAWYCNWRTSERCGARPLPGANCYALGAGGPCANRAGTKGPSALRAGTKHGPTSTGKLRFGQRRELGSSQRTRRVAHGAAPSGAAVRTKAGRVAPESPCRVLPQHRLAQV